MCVNSSPSGFDSSRIRATELPTVPNPNSAMRKGGRPFDSAAEYFSETEVFTSDGIKSFNRANWNSDASMIPEINIFPPNRR